MEQRLAASVNYKYFGPDHFSAHTQWVMEDWPRLWERVGFSFEKNNSAAVN